MNGSCQPFLIRSDTTNVVKTGIAALLYLPLEN